MKFKRDRSINVHIIDDIRIVNGEVWMGDAYIPFYDPKEFLETFNVAEYLEMKEKFMK